VFDHSQQRRSRICRSEVLYGAPYVERFGEETRRLQRHQPKKRIIAMKQPIGVVAAITRWNFHNAMLARKSTPPVLPGAR
jgi:succinate-semialdehyde dehydrogenase/glutarate-semialdehyde dehydrogenase